MKKIVVKVGKLSIGTGKIAIQSMCNTHTSDIEASYQQCVELHNAGADLVRLTTQGMREVEALSIIKSRLVERGITMPLIADVHFSHKVALAAAHIADKVRINPGNFAKEHDVAKREFANLISICKERGTAIRVGINHGSLGERTVNLYGDTPEGMAALALEWIEMAESNNFNQILFSLKSSNVTVMIQAYRLLHEQMKKRGIIYPLHLGVTEAGNGDEGRMKSASAISALFKDGIGDTIRVSLTESPLNEIYVASFIRDYFNKNKDFDNQPVNKIITENGKRILLKSYDCNEYQELILKASCDLGPMLLNKEIDDIALDAKVKGRSLSENEIKNIKDNLLQATRRIFVKPEYIACPGCGRTLFDLEKVFNEVKKRTSHLTGYNIAVMGCIVNGPGEMADADYGYVGEGKNKVTIYRGKEPVYRSVPQEEAIDKLLQLIEEDSRNRPSHPQTG